MGLDVKQQEFAILIVCKNFVPITLLLKESTIFFFRRKRINDVVEGIKYNFI